MTIQDPGFENNVINFFGDEAVAKKYLALEKIEEKIKLIWTAPIIQKFMKDYSEPDYGKSEGDSRRFRDQGNNYFKVGKDVEAVEMFNKAIMKGPLNEEHKGKDFSLAVANRSAALMRMGHLEAALEDVVLALESGYPKDLKYKLLDRKIRLAANLGMKEVALDSRSDFIISLKDSSLDEKKQCTMESEAQEILEALENDNFEKTLKNNPISKEPDDIHELKNTHSFLPCLSDKVEVEYDPKRGRFAVASCFLPAGSVILVEDAVSSVVVEEQSHRYCDYCCKKIPLQVTPCRYSAEVAYCSPLCRAKARESYYKYECGNTHIFRRILDNIKKEKEGKNRMGSTFDISRLCFRAIVKYPVEWYKKNYDSIFERFPKFGDDTWDKSVQHSLLNLVSHEDRIKQGRLWSFLISAVCHIKALQLSGYFGQASTKASKELTEDECMIGKMLVHLFMLMQFNTHGVTESTDVWDRVVGDYENKTRVVAQGLYPTLCLLNHSCDGNVTKYFMGNKVVVVASKNIAMGEEVTDEYFPSVQMFAKDLRRVWLMEHYWFDCQCSACDTDMPQLRTISTKYTNLICEKQEDEDNIKMEIEKMKESLVTVKASLENVEDRQENRKNLEQLTTIWIRLQQLVKHPYKLLYTTEQLFWRAIRVSYGNRSLRQ